MRKALLLVLLLLTGAATLSACATIEDDTPEDPELRKALAPKN